MTLYAADLGFPFNGTKEKKLVPTCSGLRYKDVLYQEPCPQPQNFCADFGTPTVHQDFSLDLTNALGAEGTQISQAKSGDWEERDVQQA